MRTSLVLAIVLGAVGCTTNVMFEDSTGPSVAVGLDDDFAAAGARHGVPEDLIKAIGYVETRWQRVDSEGHDGPAAHGVMALGGARLTRAAQLASLAEDETATDVFSNIDASTALLADAARATGVTGTDLTAWGPAIAEFSGIADPDARADYVADVYDVLRRGEIEIAESGEIIARLAGHAEIPPRASVAGDLHAAGPDFPGAVWRPSPNYSARPTGAKVSMIIIHTCEGAYAGCWGWLRSSASGVSAHYVVKEDGSEITQLVSESSKAWHIAATYDCARNGNFDCAKNGQGSNNFTVGIEHAGFESQTSFSTGQIEASAKLVCDITRDNQIPRDRNHIVGHGQLQPWNRSDPGPNWPWAAYLDRIRAICDGGGGGGGGGDPPVDLVVDSNNANNDSTRAKVSLSTSWTSASSTPGYYGSGYWFGASGATDDPATFSFYMPAAGSHAVEAWWTAGTNRSSAAQFVAVDAGGTELGQISVSQQARGSQWVTLGTWNFTAGWNRIELRRRGATGPVVIADAVRIR